MRTSRSLPQPSRLYVDPNWYTAPKPVETAVGEVIKNPELFQQLSGQGTVLIEGRDQRFAVDNLEQLERADRYMRAEHPSVVAFDALRANGVEFYENHPGDCRQQPGRAYTAIGHSQVGALTEKPEHRRHGGISDAKILQAATAMGLLGPVPVWPAITQVMESGVEVVPMGNGQRTNSLLPQDERKVMHELQNCEGYRFTINQHDFEMRFGKPASEAEFERDWKKFRREASSVGLNGRLSLKELKETPPGELKRLTWLAKLKDRLHHSGLMTNDSEAFLQLANTGAESVKVNPAFYLYKACEPTLSQPERLQLATTLLATSREPSAAALNRRFQDVVRATEAMPLEQATELFTRCEAHFDNGQYFSDSDASAARVLFFSLVKEHRNFAAAAQRLEEMKAQRRGIPRVVNRPEISWRRPGLFGLRPRLDRAKVQEMLDRDTSFGEALEMLTPAGTATVYGHSDVFRVLDYLDSSAKARAFKQLLDQGYRPVAKTAEREPRAAEPLPTFVGFGRSGYLHPPDQPLSNDRLLAPSAAEMRMLATGFTLELEGLIPAGFQLAVPEGCSKLPLQLQLAAALEENRPISVTAPEVEGRATLTATSPAELGRLLMGVAEDASLLASSGTNRVNYSAKDISQRFAPKPLTLMQQLRETSIDEADAERQALAGLVARGWATEAALAAVEAARIPFGNKDLAARVEAIAERLKAPRYSWEVDRAVEKQLKEEALLNTRVRDGMQNLLSEQLDNISFEFEEDGLAVDGYRLIRN